MKKLYILLIILSLPKILQACSCMFTSSFCETTSNGNSLIISGQIIEKFNNGIKVKILQRFRGTELKDTINIWNSSGNPCIGPTWISGDVNEFGNINDTMVASINKIDSINNSWDLIGDYHVESPSCGTYFLKVNNDTVIGSITSGYYFGMKRSQEKVQYTTFVNQYNESLNRCGVSSLNEFQSISQLIYPNPSSDEINIEFPSFQKGEIELLNYLGQSVYKESFSGKELKVLKNQLPPGIYFLLIKTEGQVINKKIVFN